MEMKACFGSGCEGPLKQSIFGVLGIAQNQPVIRDSCVVKISQNCFLGPQKLRNAEKWITRDSRDQS